MNESMYMAYPATRWQDATPCGNGEISTLVYGNIHEELIVVNHEDLWLRGNRAVLGEFDSESFAELRKKIFEGKYKEALSYYVRQVGRNYQKPENIIEPYQPAFDIILKTKNHKAFSDYQRSLNFNSGESVVQWKEAESLFERKSFVSRKDNAIVMQYQSNGDRKIDCAVTLSPHDFQNLSSMGAGRDIEKHREFISFEATVDDEWLVLKCKQNNGDEYGGVAKLLCTNGTATAKDGSLHVRSAEQFILIVKLYLKVDTNEAIQKLKQEINALSASYELLLKRHMECHLPLFHSVSLDLKTPENSCFNETLLQQSYNGNVETALVEKMFHYGRYLFISSSCIGGLPPNLQGIWNGDYNPAWASDYHNDENIQMNYWHALPGNLSELVIPFFDYYESLLEDFKENAKKIYGCRGILVPVSQTTNGLIWPDCWMYWTAGAGWLAQLFYDYWLYTGDREFLRNRVIPFLREVALFYEDFTFEDEFGKLLFAPSLSPENEPDVPGKSFLSINATMDIAVCKEVLHNLCDAYQALDIDSEEIEKWKEMLKKLPDYEINKDGAFQEWLYPGLNDNYSHRHLSHIYPLFPGFEITEETNPKFYDALKTAVNKRLTLGLDAQSGWSLVHMGCTYARLGKGNEALGCIEMLCRSCVGPNLFTYHNDWRSQGITMFWGHGNQPPFQIDANLGIVAMVLEMLIFSKPGMIKILPALPNKWKKGKVEGLQCRGAVTASIEWNLDVNQLKVELLSRFKQEMTLKFPFAIVSAKVSSHNAMLKEASYGDSYRKIMLPANDPVQLKISLQIQ